MGIGSPVVMASINQDIALMTCVFGASEVGFQFKSYNAAGVLTDAAWAFFAIQSVSND